MQDLKVRTNARRLIDRAVRPLGARLVPNWEDVAAARRYRAVVEQLAAAYTDKLTPPLRDRPGRLELLCALRGTEVSEALHLVHALQQATEGPGDICEFGVAQGATSALLANEVLDSDRNLWLYDSFRGLSVPDADKDELIDDIFGLGSMERYAGAMASGVESVRQQLRAVGFPEDRTVVVEGFIHRDLPADRLPDTVALAYLDFDLYEPIHIALDLMHPRCRPGSILMIDDYGYFSTGPQAAVEEFLAVHEDRYEQVPAPPGAGHFCILRRKS